MSVAVKLFFLFLTVFVPLMYSCMQPHFEVWYKEQYRRTAVDYNTCILPHANNRVYNHEIVASDLYARYIFILNIK